MNDVQGPTILLRNGNYFNFLEPDDAVYEIEEVAHALAHICRFGGHGHRFYSVAQHAVHTSRLVAPEYAYAALMHDNAEFVIGDMVSPLASLLPDYRTLKARIERSVAARFNVPHPMPEAVKKADLVMLRTEQKQIMKNGDSWAVLANVPSHPVNLPTWSPETARTTFLNRYRELLP